MPCVAANNTLPTSLLDQDPLYLPAASLDGFDSAALAPILGSTPPHELGPAVKRTLTERCRPLLASSVGAPSNRILSLHAVLREPIPHARLTATELFAHFGEGCAGLDEVRELPAIYGASRHRAELSRAVWTENERVFVS